MKKGVKALKKILIFLMIIVLLNNFLLSTQTYAVDDKTDSIEEEGQGFFLSFLGLLTLPARAIALGIGYAINALTAAVAYIEGATDTNVDTKTITPFDIFFNKVKILDINFFEIGSDVNIVNTIRTGIAAWYYALRLIAMSILLVVLIYIGIRMAISTVATDKAMYKRMLMDWVVSLVLIFLINYIIIFVISVNNAVVSAIEKGVKVKEISETYDTIRNLGFKWVDIDSIPATVIYCMLVAQVLGLVISYFNRMLKVAFLIIISPLITLTYAVDKMGDGKAQALGNWIREFVFTVITQIFHCIIYMSMINVAFDLLVERSGEGIRHALAAAVMAILCVNFVRTAENLVRKILMHNHQDNTVSFSGGMAMTAAALSKSKSIGSAGRKAINTTKQNFRAAGNALKSVPRAAGAVIKAPKRGVQAISDAIKVENKWKEEAKSKGYTKSDKKDYKAKKKEVKYTAKQGLKAARLQEAKIKKEKKIAKRNESLKKHPIKRKIAGAASYIKREGKAIGTKGKLSRIAAESDALKFIGRVAKDYTAMGVGLATGSMMYGSTGKAGQSILLGVAAGNSAKAFLKTSATIENNSISSAIAAGARTKEEAFALFNAVAANPDLFNGKSTASLKQAENLLKRIGDQLEKLYIDPEMKREIKNTIDQTARANPERMPAAINSVISNIANERAKKLYPSELGSDGKDKNKQRRNDYIKNIVNNQDLRNACNDYATFANMKQIYSHMEAAAQMGISRDTYVQDCTEKFVELEESHDEQQMSDLAKIMSDPNREHVEGLADNASPELKTELIKQFDEERERIDQEIKDASEEMKNQLDEQLKALDRAEAEVLMSLEEAKLEALNDSQKEVLERVKDECNREIDEILNSLGLNEAEKKSNNYLNIAAGKARIDNSALEELTIDGIISKTENQIKKENDEKLKSGLNEYLTKAKAYKQLVTLDGRKEKVNVAINKTQKN